MRGAFNADKAISICERDSLDFGEYAERYDLQPNHRTGGPRFYYHQDNGSEILAVAHLDNVQEVRKTAVTMTGAAVLSSALGGLDDRLGAYVILELLPALGMQFDILLTTDEETCQSTAEMFTPTKQYDWMIEFDRGGSDVVLYDYETPELVKLVVDRAPVETGSDPDIRDPATPGVCWPQLGRGLSELSQPPFARLVA